VAKDRAAPFSRKHRRYWIPVTGGMLLIGAINLTIGLCSYREPSVPPERIELVLPRPPADAAGTLGVGDLPTPVMRAFNQRYPRTLPAGARADRDAGTFDVLFAPGAPHHSATFRADGTFVSED
jgi:hypothetical protein